MDAAGGARRKQVELAAIEGIGFVGDRLDAEEPLAGTRIDDGMSQQI